jgi:feruloyl esterase
LVFQEALPESIYDGLFYWVFGSSFGILSSPVNYENFDFHNDIALVDSLLAKPLNAVSTDLSAFKQLGNKLIMFHGWAHPVIPSQSSINYFNALVSHDSQADEGVRLARFEPDGGNNLHKTQQYARLFMVPGMYHCSGGPGPNVFDAVTPLVKWVEQGVAPETIIAPKFVNGTKMTRPLCVFPKVAKYKGNGAASVASNFPASRMSPTSIKRRRPSTGRDDLRFTPSQKPMAKPASKPRLPATR